MLEIFCSLVRNKLIAWLIGPAGLGLVILYNSVINLVSQSTRLSIDQSAQRNISQSSAAEAPVTVAVVRRWAIWLGLAGMAVMCILSPMLSYWSFDTMSRWPDFCLLSVVTFGITFYSCINAENQGLRRFKAVAKINVVVSVVSLAVVIPLIVWLRIKSIIWIILAYGVVTMIAGYIYRPRVGHVALTRHEVFEKGRSFIRLGGLITVALLAGQAFNYFFVLYLNTFASTEQLGIYQSGFTIMNSYVGIVFTAVWMEYYPRISAIAHSPRRLSLSASHEARLTLTFLAPLLCLLVIFIRPIVLLIYSSDFLPVTPYIILGCVGVVLRLMSFCLVYIILARGDGSIYVFTEILSGIVGLALNIVGYNLAGFTGLGLAYVAWYAFYLAIAAAVCRYRYGVSYFSKVWLLGLTATALVTVIALIALHHPMFPTLI